MKNILEVDNILGHKGENVYKKELDLMGDNFFLICNLLI